MSNPFEFSTKTPQQRAASNTPWNLICSAVGLSAILLFAGAFWFKSRSDDIQKQDELAVLYATAWQKHELATQHRKDALLNEAIKEIDDATIEISKRWQKEPSQLLAEYNQRYPWKNLSKSLPPERR